MDTIPQRFLEFSLRYPEIWPRLINRRLHHHQFGDGFIKEIGSTKSPLDLKNSFVIIEFDNEIELSLNGLTHILEISFQAFNGNIITKISLPVEIADEDYATFFL